MGNVIERRHAAAVGHVVKPLAAARKGIRELKHPAPPALVEIKAEAIAVAAAHHDILIPAAVVNKNIGAHGHYVAACLIESRQFKQAAGKEVLPPHLIMLRRTRLVAVYAWHAEVGRQVPVVKPQAMIKLLHL